MNDMKTSDRGLVALMRHEGIVPGPYLDSVGIWTVYVGHTAAAGAPDPSKMRRGMPADLDGALREALALFRGDVARYEAAVDKAVTVPLKQHEFDALVSFHYNTGAIGRASAITRLNAGDKAGAAEALMLWKKPPEIVKRRSTERRLFEEGAYPSGSITVWGVTGAGKVVWKPARVLSKAEALAFLTPDPKPAAVRAPGWFGRLRAALLAARDF